MATGEEPMESLDDMIFLVEVAESGSFTEASARLSVPKSTISQRIKRLEKRLGLQLLSRSTRRVSLTSNGQVFLEYCRRVRAEVKSASVAMINLKERPTGLIRLTCPEITASYFMPRFLYGFTKQFPNVEVDLLATNENLDIIRERIDFAFRVGSVSNKDLFVRKISPIKRILVASPAYLKHSEPMTLPEHLAKHRCLVHQAHAVWSFSMKSDIVKVTPSAVMQSNSIGFLLQASIAGNGLAVLPAYVCAPYISTGALVEAMPQWRIPAHQMIMVSSEVRNLSKAQAAFRGYVDAYDFTPLSSGAEIFQ
jgi:DNA-binding transcriptional LysR family regulator